MASENNLTAVFTDIANAIRSKKGTTNNIQPINMSDEIDSIEVGIGGGNSGNLEKVSEFPTENIDNSKVYYKKGYVNKDVIARVEGEMISMSSYLNAGIEVVDNFPSNPQTTNVDTNYWYFYIINDIPYIFNGETWAKASEFYSLITGTEIQDKGHIEDISLAIEENSIYVMYDFSDIYGVPEQYVYQYNGYEWINNKKICYELLNRNLVSFGFPSSMNEIGKYAFAGCEQLSKLSNTQNITRINEHAFQTCISLTSADFPSVIDINDNAFEFCTTLTNTNFPSVKIVRYRAFRGCSSLTTIDLPLVENIMQFTFEGCGSLTTINLPSVSNIEDYAFFNCSSLSSLILRANKVCVLLGTYALSGTPIGTSGGFIYVPDDLVEQYKVATNWSTYASKIKGLSELPTE